MTENASPPYGLENSFKNTFPLDGKKLSLERVSEKREKISSTSQKISFHKQKLPPPNFKTFNKALNKKNTLSVSTSRNKEFVKKKRFHRRKNCFLQAEMSVKQKKTVFH